MKPATQDERTPGKSANRKRTGGKKRECKFIDAGAEESDADKRSSDDENESDEEEETEADRLFINDDSFDMAPMRFRRVRRRTEPAAPQRRRVFKAAASRELSKDDMDLIEENAGVAPELPANGADTGEEVCGCYADSDEEGQCEDDEGFVVMSKEEKAAMEAGIKVAAALKQMRRTAGAHSFSLGFLFVVVPTHL